MVHWLGWSVNKIHITSVCNDCQKALTLMSSYYQVYLSYMWYQATVTCKLISKLFCSEWLKILFKTDYSGWGDTIVSYGLKTNMGNVATVSLSRGHQVMWKQSRFHGEMRMNEIGLVQTRRRLLSRVFIATCGRLTGSIVRELWFEMDIMWDAYG